MTSDGIDALELALQLEHEEVLLLRAQRDRLRSELNEAKSHVEGFVRAGAQLARERDALLAAAKHLDEQFEPDPEFETGPEECDCERCKARVALRAAVAACEEDKP